MRRIFLTITLLMLSALAEASLQVATGQFAASTGGSTTTVTSTFQGKAVIFFTHAKTTNPESALASFSLGFSDGTHHGGASWAGNDAASTTVEGRGNWNTRATEVFTSGTPAAGTNGFISGVTFNSGNFVVTWGAPGTPGSAWLVDYILLGGTDITDVFVGSAAMPITGCGPPCTLNVTGPGFQPDFVLMTTAYIAGSTTSTGAFWGVGAAVSSTKRWSFSEAVVNGAALTANVKAATIIRNDLAVVGLNSSDAVSISADFTQFTANGFDLSFSAVPGTANVIEYLAIKGGRWDLGSAAKPTTATAQSVTGESFQPKMLGLFTSSATANNTATSNAVTSFGATDGTNQEFASSFHNNAINTVAQSSGSTSAVLLDRDGTNNPSAAFTSFNSDGWTITWNATGSARQVGWFTAADSVSGVVRHRAQVIRR